jgi:hypothetical protein
MKTKLLAMILLAGGSMFAQTRFSFGINVGGNARGYHQPAVPSYRGGYQVAPRYDNRYNEQNRFQSRSFDRDGDRDDRGRGYGHDYRPGNGYVNRFRGR